MWYSFVHCIRTPPDLAKNPVAQFLINRGPWLASLGSGDVHLFKICELCARYSIQTSNNEWREGVWLCSCEVRLDQHYKPVCNISVKLSYWRGEIHIVNNIYMIDLWFRLASSVCTSEHTVFITGKILICCIYCKKIHSVTSLSGWQTVRSAARYPAAAVASAKFCWWT